MAVVYLARHVMIERLSAIKILRQDLGLNVSHRERFLREARAVNRINHPNIVEITDFGEDGGLVFLVMEYVEGESLQSALAARAASTWSARSRIALQIAAALGRAHELGVDPPRPQARERAPRAPRRDGLRQAHRLRDREDRRRARAHVHRAALRHARVHRARVHRRSSRRPPSAISTRSASSLYEMVTGALPFDAKLPVELLAAALREASP